MKSRALCLLSILLVGLPPMLSRAQSPNNAPAMRRPTGATERVYKHASDADLTLFIYGLTSNPSKAKKSAIVFFFGGGWRGGTPAQFEPHCQYLAERGMVAITAEYRVSSRHSVKALQCVLDAKSAIRWVREHASELGIDPDRIAAGGGSAGGHLAACTGLINGIEELDEDLTVSSRPNALLLFNPALVLATAEGYLNIDTNRHEQLEARMGIEPKNLSPFHHVRPNAPPTIIFHGRADTTVPFVTAKAFHEAMLVHGNQSQLKGYPGMPHGFFNFGKYDNQPFTSTVTAADEFLVSLGFLDGVPHVGSFVQQQQRSR